jgi:hypothetical protein
MACHRFNEIKMAIALSSFDVEQQLSQHQTAAPPEGVWCTRLCKVEHRSGHCQLRAIVLLIGCVQFLIPHWPSSSLIVQV